MYQSQPELDKDDTKPRGIRTIKLGDSYVWLTTMRYLLPHEVAE